MNNRHTTTHTHDAWKWRQESYDMKKQITNTMYDKMQLSIVFS